MSSPGNILNYKWNFSYIFNTDGYQTSDSSKVSAWPFYLKLNELPPKERDNNMILAAIWVNEEKPPMNNFLQSIIQELNEIATDGIQWKMNDEVITSKIIPLCCSVDSVCRCAILNMKQYNGFYGCTFCYHPTENVEGLRKYPISQKVYPLRTHTDIIQKMTATRSINEETGKIDIKEIEGIKGPSILMNFKYFNMSDGMTPDSMHSVYLGVVEQYTNLILKNVNTLYYIGSPNVVKMIDDRLLSIEPPTIITRTPRSLSTRNMWKASEWRSWLLVYCLIYLHGILPQKYFEHLSQLVAVIQILSSESISQTKLEEAHVLLIKFIVYFEKYFGKSEMTYNIHLLYHLVHSVVNVGPLQMHDTFSFENENRLLLQMVHSPTEKAVQICKRYLFYRAVPSFCTQFSISNRVIEFSDDFENRIKFYVKVKQAVLISGKDYEFNDDEQKLGYMVLVKVIKKLFTME